MIPEITRDGDQFRAFVQDGRRSAQGWFPTLTEAALWADAKLVEWSGRDD